MKEELVCYLALFLISSLSFLGAGGCTQQQVVKPPAGETISPVAVVSPTYLLRTRMPETRLIATASPSVTLSAMSTHTSVPTTKPTETQTWSPAPKLPPQKAQALVRDLLENNGGCRLPCWWGMTPGQTDWNTAKYYLDTFVKDIEVYQEGQIKQGDESIQWTSYRIHYVSQSNEENVFIVGVMKGIVQEIWIGGNAVRKLFLLGHLLSNYGPPDEVYIKAHRYTNEGGPLPFTFLLNYSSHNFWAEFNLDGEVEWSSIKGCPQSIEPRIWLGSPERKWELSNLLVHVFGPSIPNAPKYPILTLSEATGMDLETFTEVFKDPNNTKCLETPADLWF